MTQIVKNHSLTHELQGTTLPVSLGKPQGKTVACWAMETDSEVPWLYSDIRQVTQSLSLNSLICNIGIN